MALTPTLDLFLRRMLMHEHKDLENSINNLQNEIAYLEVTQLTSATSGLCVVPKEGGGYMDVSEYTIIKNLWPDITGGGGASDGGVAQVDASGLPLDTSALTAGGVPITIAINSGGNYTMSGTPAAVPVAIVFYITVLVNATNKLDPAYVRRVVLDQAGGVAPTGAPTTAYYLLSQPNISLPNGISLGALTNGLLKISVTGGIATVGVAGNTDSIALQALTLGKNGVGGVAGSLNLLDGANPGSSKSVTYANYNNTNWDTAYGWGNHASAGYITAVVADSPLSGAGTSGSHLTVDLSGRQAHSIALDSIAALSFLSTSFVKMTAAGTFGLDTIVLGSAATHAASDFQVAGSYEVLINKVTDFSTVNNTLYPTVQAVQNYVGGLLVGMFDDRGNYDASVNVFPSTGGRGVGGLPIKGDIWFISVAGTLGGVAVSIGSSVRALVDTPGQTAANWDILNVGLGYVPENVNNKVTSISASSTDVQYPSAKLLYDQLAGKLGTGLAVLTDQTAGQTIGATGARLTKLWATDITVTNAIAGSVTGQAGSVSGLTITAGASISGSNTGDQTLASLGGVLNVFTTIGDILYCSVTGTPGTVQRLTADTSNVRKFLRTLSITGSPQIPAWDTLQSGDIPNISATYSVKAGNSSIVTTGTITTGGLGTGAVIGGVTMTLGSDAAYDLYYRESTGVLTRIPNGTTGKFLGATTGSAPSWLTPSGGGSPAGSAGDLQMNNGSSAFAYGGLNYTASGTVMTYVSGMVMKPTTNGVNCLNFTATNGTTSILSIDANNGRVGIGTTSPSNRLQVVSADSATSVGSLTATVSIGNSDTTNNNYSLLSFQGMGTDGSYYGVGRIGAQITNHNAVSVSGDLVFHTRNSGTFQESMRITGTGNVGIGLTAPVSQLHLDAGNATASALKFTAGTTTGQTATNGFNVGIDASANALIWQYGNLPIIFGTNNTEYLRLSALGNLSTRSANYFYKDTSPTADTVNDIRFYNNANAFTLQMCGISSATKGGGTWIPGNMNVGAITTDGTNLWQFGAAGTGTNVLDTTNYLSVKIGVTTYKLALIV